MGIRGNWDRRRVEEYGRLGEIAARLFLSLKIIQNHVSNIFGKLRVADRVRAAFRAWEAGLGG